MPGLSLQREMEALKGGLQGVLDPELFFLQHLQGNMMDFLAFKKKHYAPLQAYLGQNDLDLEEEDEEEGRRRKEEKSEGYQRSEVRSSGSCYVELSLPQLPNQK